MEVKAPPLLLEHRLVPDSMSKGHGEELKENEALRFPLNNVQAGANASVRANGESNFHPEI